MTPKLIDVHTHVQFAAFSTDYKKVIEQALNQGVWLINSGTQKDTSEKAVRIAEDYKEGVYATVGLHPIHTESSHYDVKELGGERGGRLLTKGEIFDRDYYKNLACRPKVVAVGECGLDFYRLGEETREKQVRAFIEQIKLAFEIKKPIIIHCRDAYPELLDILESYNHLLLDFPGVIHFFSGEKRDAEKLLEMGFCFSFGGVVTFIEKYGEIIRKIPLEKILLETDAPYVAPVPFRGRRNEPSYIIEVARKIAEIKEMPLEEVSRRTTETALRLFNLAAC